MALNFFRPAITTTVCCVGVHDALIAVLRYFVMLLPVLERGRILRILSSQLMQSTVRQDSYHQVSRQYFSCCF
jgi:hypothetical protein